MSQKLDLVRKTTALFQSTDDYYNSLNSWFKMGKSLSDFKPPFDECNFTVEGSFEPIIISYESLENFDPIVAHFIKSNNFLDKVPFEKAREKIIGNFYLYFRDGKEEFNKSNIQKSLSFTAKQIKSKFLGKTYIIPIKFIHGQTPSCLLYTSPSPRDATLSRMPSSA